MSNKIKIKPVDADTVEVKISSDTPVELVEQLTKSLTDKGLIQDSRRSTLSTRYFYKARRDTNKIIDNLLKSLQSMAKVNEANSGSSRYRVNSAITGNNRAVNNGSTQHRGAVDNKQIDKELNKENILANQLANMMMRNAVINPYRMPTTQEMIAAGETLGLAGNPELAKKQEEQWNNSINNWLIEATKPISQRFSSPEEELAYWNSIKIEDRDDGATGY